MSINYDQSTAQKISKLYWDNTLKKIIEKPLEIIRAIVDTIIAKCVRIEKAAIVAENKKKKTGRLTRREQDCFNQLALGVCKNDAIAAALKLSPRTVEMHFENIRKKYGDIGKKKLIKLAKKTGNK
jgi:DNA-binding CsgD family transcriptional regulator